MKVTLTREQMLQLWRTHHADEPLRLDCTVTRTDGTDYDRLHTRRMRAWYLDMLDNADESLLDPQEVAPQARLQGRYGATHVVLPDTVRRILRLTFAGWSSPMTPDADPAEVRRRAANPYALRPLVARISPREVIVSGARGELTSVTAIVDPGEETYTFDHKLYGKLP